MTVDDGLHRIWSFSEGYAILLSGVTDVFRQADETFSKLSTHSCR
jgi:hypothetical protein